METTEKLLEKLSNKFNEVYDLELTDIFVNLTSQVKKDNRKYFSLAKKLAELQIKCEKLKKEKEQAEYDKEYFEKILKEK